jgi:hypothetical protein
MEHGRTHRNVGRSMTQHATQCAAQPARGPLSKPPRWPSSATPSTSTRGADNVSASAVSRGHAGSDARQYGQVVVKKNSTCRPLSARSPIVTLSPWRVAVRNVGTNGSERGLRARARSFDRSSPSARFRWTSVSTSAASAQATMESAESRRNAKARRERTDGRHAVVSWRSDPRLKELAGTHSRLGTRRLP